MSVDVTPDTDANQEVNVGDNFTFEVTFDEQITQADLTLTIHADSGDVTATGSALTETDNGDGTYTYSYTHELDARHTAADWDLDSGDDHAHESCHVNAKT